VTYHVALHRNPGKTALIFSHRDPDCLYRHYLGIATKAASRMLRQFLRGTYFVSELPPRTQNSEK
jgi:hypothetical protein